MFDGALKLKSIFIWIIVLIFTFSNLMSQDWQWAKKIAGTGTISMVRMIIGSGNNNYFVGNYNGSQVSLGDSVFDPYGINDILIGSFSATGTFRWARRIGGTDDDVVSSIAIDNVNNVYVIGSYKSNPVYFSTQDSLENSNLFDTFLAKYDHDGNLLSYQRLFWGSKAQRMNDLIIDDDRIVITGFFRDELIYFNGSENDTIPTKGISNKDLLIAIYYTAGTYQAHKIFTTNQARTQGRRI